MVRKIPGVFGAKPARVDELTRPPPLLRAPGLREALAVAAAVILIDVAVNRVLPPLHRGSTEALWRIALLRGGESALLAGYWLFRVGGPATLGLVGEPLRRGLRVAFFACLALGSIAATGELAFRLTDGSSFLSMLAASGRNPSPALFVAMCVLGPIFEEFLFRALLYASFRTRAGVLLSTLLVTAVFAAMHLPSTQVPLIQVVGGVFFALSLEYSGSLLSPVLIHVAGNTAIFLLPLFF